jgi:hypothetical protein
MADQIQVSQVVAETEYQATPQVNVSHVIAETEYQTTPRINISQLIAEVEYSEVGEATYSITASGGVVLGGESVVNTVNLLASDTFETLNQWTETNPTASIVSDKLRLNVTTSGGSTFASVQSKYYLVGNFDISIDFSILNKPSSGNWEYGLILNRGYVNDYILIKNYTTEQNKYFSELYGSAGVEIPTSDTSGKLRLVRLGSVIYSYYWSGSAWVEADHRTEDTTSCLVSISIYRQLEQTTVAEFDNFLVTLYNNDTTSIGGEVLGGSSVIVGSGSSTYIITSSGGLVLGGSSVIVGTGSSSYAFASVGGVVFGGTAVIPGDYIWVTSGGMVLSGAIGITANYNNYIVSSGGEVLSGSGSIESQFGFVVVSSDGIVFGGTGGALASGGIISSGGFVLSFNVHAVTESEDVIMYFRLVTRIKGVFKLLEELTTHL